MDVETRALSRRCGTNRPLIEGRRPALYVMILAHGGSAKIGALESTLNATIRLGRVQAAHRRRDADDSCYPMRLAVVIEIEDLPIAGDHDADSEERWAEVEHLESALRLVLARRLGRLARWTDWIHIETAIDDAEWPRLIDEAWDDVVALGTAKKPEMPGRR